MLNKIQLEDMLERLADHAIEGHLQPDEICDELEKRIVQNLLDLHGGNQCHVAIRLRCHRNTLDRRMQALGIRRAQDRR